MITIAIVEDHQAELDGFIKELSAESDLRIVATAGTAQQARELFPPLVPDIVIVDLVLPDSTGAALIVELKAALPQTSFLVVSAYEDYDRIYSAIIAGAVGYLGKVYLKGDLAQAVRDIHEGGSPMSSPIARKVINAFHVAAKPSMKISQLSEREQEVLHILATGRSYQDIASSLFISVETVRTHVRNIYRKLQVHSVSEINHSELFRPGQKPSSKK